MVKNNIIEIYQINMDSYSKHITKKVFVLGDRDKLEIKEGYVSITLVDNYQNGHNGNWEDEHESGYLTFELAKKDMLKTLKCRYEADVACVKALKEIVCSD